MGVQQVSEVGSADACAWAPKGVPTTRAPVATLRGHPLHFGEEHASFDHCSDALVSILMGQTPHQPPLKVVILSAHTRNPHGLARHSGQRHMAMPARFHELPFANDNKCFTIWLWSSMWRWLRNL